MSSSASATVLSKKVVLILILDLLLLIAGAVGIWDSVQNLYADEGVRHHDAMSSMLYMGVLPLLVAILLSIYAAAYTGSRWSSSGFQNRIDLLMQRLNDQDDMFHMLTDQTPSALTIFNGKNEYWFVNASAAHRLGDAGVTVMGKTPVAVLGAEKGRLMERLLDAVRANGQITEHVERDLDERGHIVYRQIRLQPVQSVPGLDGGVLAREEDVTSLVVERERRETMLRQVISTLVAVVDRRDPYASGHSGRVGQLSRALAAEMRLGETDVEAAEIAGSLMNFGKVLVSRSILTKNEGLTPEELRRIRDGILTSAEILSLIDFRLPVVPTLQQVLERVDGTGVPKGLRGEEILLTARIVAVANAFVAMVSPRAYRPGVEPLEAVARLAQQAGSTFDKAVITALEQFVRKHDGRLNWLIPARL